MSKLETLKAATTLHDVAHLLGFKPKSLSYILYKKPITEKYQQFEIPKRTGGTRLISAPYPELMNLQRRLSELLQDCVAEINSNRSIESALSHGFRRKHSIITNAAVHRNKRYVLNIDLENFFGTINFGRVRGFFTTNRNFKLNPAVATVLAQIACHENALPQGSPCSPVISNLIGHLLDVRLAALAFQTGCSYSRYADDITFSTNKRVFPQKLAKPVEGSEHDWQAGTALSKITEKTGFSINPAKTRVQYENCRQEVTGLVINTKVNTRVEYRHTARAMVHRLLKTGSFQRRVTAHDKEGNPIVTTVDGTLDQLNGMLSFIDSINVFNRKKGMPMPKRGKPLKMADSPDCSEKNYRRFLFYKYFFASPKPLIVCEGKTDNIYIRAAIRHLVSSYPRLAQVDEKGVAKPTISLFRRTATTDRILGLTGGSDQFINLIKGYMAESARITTNKRFPVIVLIDNDDGAKGTLRYASKIAKVTAPPKEEPHLAVDDHFYIVPTPLTSDGKDTMIEDFFEESVKKITLNGKTFNPKNEDLHHKGEYGKAYFATHVVKPNEHKIDFSGFKPLLDRIQAVIDLHSKKHP